MARFAWPGAIVAIAAMGFGYMRDSNATAASNTSSDKVHHLVVEEHTSATVVRELRALSRLETTTLRVEKVIELKDHQTRLHGFVDADDKILFVASGEVVLGVDLAKLEDGDVRMDEAASRVASIELPAPEILSTRFDENKSYVHARTTDMLAQRNEGLEASARREALAAFTVAGRDAQAMDGAKAQAEKQLRSLAKAWGAKDLIVTWKAPRGEVAVK